MNKASFVSKIYKVFAITIPVYFLANNIVILFNSSQIYAIIPIIIQIAVVICILTRHKYVKYVIKIYSLLFIFSGGLLVLSQIFFLLGDPIGLILILS